MGIFLTSILVAVIVGVVSGIIVDGDGLEDITPGWICWNRFPREPL